MHWLQSCTRRYSLLHGNFVMSSTFIFQMRALRGSEQRKYTGWRTYTRFDLHGLNHKVKIVDKAVKPTKTSTRAERNKHAHTHTQKKNDSRQWYKLKKRKRQRFEMCWKQSLHNILVAFSKYTRNITESTNAMKAWGKNICAIFLFIDLLFAAKIYNWWLLLNVHVRVPLSWSLKGKRPIQALGIYRNITMANEKNPAI